MKPFNLEQALAGKPVVTRDGREVTELHLFKTVDKYPLLAVIGENSFGYYRDGCFDNTESPLDLLMAPEKVTKWFNVLRYENLTNKYFTSALFDTEDEAKNQSVFLRDNYIKTSSITFEI